MLQYQRRIANDRENISFLGFSTHADLYRLYGICSDVVRSIEERLVDMSAGINMGSLYKLPQEVLDEMKKQRQEDMKDPNYVASPMWSKRSDNETGHGDYSVYNARGQFLEEVLACDNATAAVSWYNCNVHSGLDTTFQAEYAECNCEYEDEDELPKGSYEPCAKCKHFKYQCECESFVPLKDEES